MNKAYVIFSIAALAVIPYAALAHGMMDFNQVDSPESMMRYVEDQAVGEEAHDEMEELMVKMMSGNLTEQEAGRMIALMDQYPGSYGMMMNRMMGGGAGFGNMMTGYGGLGSFGNVWPWIFQLGMVVWLVVGILAIVWLFKKIQAK